MPSRMYSQAFYRRAYAGCYFNGHRRRKRRHVRSIRSSNKYWDRLLSVDLCSSINDTLLQRLSETDKTMAEDNHFTFPCTNCPLRFFSFRSMRLHSHECVAASTLDHILNQVCDPHRLFEPGPPITELNPHIQKLKFYIGLGLKPRSADKRRHSHKLRNDYENVMLVQALDKRLKESENMPVPTDKKQDAVEANEGLIMSKAERPKTARDADIVVMKQLFKLTEPQKLISACDKAANNRASNNLASDRKATQPRRSARLLKNCITESVTPPRDTQLKRKRTSEGKINQVDKNAKIQKISGLEILKEALDLKKNIKQKQKNKKQSQNNKQSSSSKVDAENALLRCKKCGEEMRGERTFTLHYIKLHCRVTKTCKKVE